MCNCLCPVYHSPSCAYSSVEEERRVVSDNCVNVAVCADILSVSSLMCVKVSDKACMCALAQERQRRE